MPIYEYVCDNCNTEQELISRFNDPNPICDHCGKEMRRKISLSSFHLKGNGWYASDYKNTDIKKTESTTKENSSGENVSSGIPTDM